MKKIEMGKKYRAGFLGGTLRYVDGKRPGLPVLWECDDGGAMFLFDEFGRNDSYSFNLVEVSPYTGIPIDTPGWARAQGFSGWYPCHFAGVRQGVPFAFASGSTSHTAPEHSPAYQVALDEFTTIKPEGV